MGTWLFLVLSFYGRHPGRGTIGQLLARSDWPGHACEHLVPPRLKLGVRRTKARGVGMAGAARYGLVVGIASVFLFNVLPQPWGVVLFFGGLAIQLAVAAQVCWRRTGLPFASAAMALGAVLAQCLVVLALFGQPYPDLAPGSWVLVAGGALLGPFFLRMESRIHHDKWEAWKLHMKGMGVLDVLTGRHIPNLRVGRT